MNSRDIGGYKAKKDISKKGVIFRSGSLTCLQEIGKEEMLLKGIDTIIDLRSPNAKKREIDPTSLDSRFIYLPFRMQSGEKLPSSREEALEIYRKMYASKEELKPIMLAIASAKRGVLIHCSAGKDRTGVIISLLQYIIGVSLDDINGEYLLSYDDIDPHVRHLREIGVPVSPIYYQKDETFLPSAFLALEREFKSKEAYFAYLGLDSSLLAAIEKKELL